MVSDTIGDMIVRLKNAQMAGQAKTLVPFSNYRWAIVELLKAEGYVKAINKKGKKIKKFIEIDLIYQDGAPKIREAKRISKPSCRVYHRAGEVRSVRRGYGLAVYSTPRGVLSDKAAREAKVGGEILFQLW